MTLGLVVLGMSVVVLVGGTTTALVTNRPWLGVAAGLTAFVLAYAAPLLK